MNILVLCPHYAPDVAPTGEVMTAIVEALAARGHRLHVVTALPWYRHHAIEDGWAGRPARTESTPWGWITRLHPFPTDKTNIPARAVAFAGFTGMATVRAAFTRIRPDVVMVMSPPLPLGVAGWLAAIIRGAHMLPVKSFDLEEVLPRIARERISMIPGPPTIYQSLLAHPRRGDYDLSSLRLAVTGAAPVPVALVEQMRAELGFEVVVTAYGLTETCGVVSICRADDSPERISHTSGRAMDGVEMKCVDAAGATVPVGIPGEICCRGFNVMRGYLDNPEETARCMTADGWLKTGDVGVMDEDGYVRITDRIKDMFIVGGFNCYPAEIENTLCSLPGVARAAVIGVPDTRLGEVARAYIVRAAGAQLDEAGVIAWCRDNMANYKVPRAVRFVEELPVNAGGKVLKTALREMAEAEAR